MIRCRWVFSLLVPAVLLPGAVQPLPAQEEIERTGLRPDAPEYGVRGPHWAGYRPVVIGEGSGQQLASGLWYPALKPDGSGAPFLHGVSSGRDEG